jgi:hypothetical protein
VLHRVIGFLRMLPESSSSMKDVGIRLWWGVVAGLFVKEMKLPIK